MSQTVNRRSGTGGIITLFTRHPTAANLLMIVLILGGLLSLAKLNRQFFPDFGIDVVQISVLWPGATAEDVEQTIIEAIEPEVRFLDSVKRVTSVAREGAGTVYVEYQPRSDMQRALSEVEQAVSQVTTLPEDAEQPEVRRIVRYDSVTRLVLSGPYDPLVLKHWAKTIREDLLDRGVDRVRLTGARDEQIVVEIEPERLRQLDTTLSEIAGTIGDSSQDLPAGDIEGVVERQPRAIGLARTAGEIGEIEVVATPTGERLTVDDIASIEDEFDDDQTEVRRRGQNAIEIQVQRSTDADALDVAALVRDYLVELRQRLPPSLVLEEYDVQASLITDRIDLLVKSGLGGALIVVSLLLLFLAPRVAFWVAVGIPVSLMAMLVLMLWNGQSINMISLFAMILAIGIVVDDAIVVGEHASWLREQGLAPELAAEQAAQRMFWPVTSATATTVAAFMPILFVGDIIGTIIREIPLVVIFVLIASLIECFLILPHHLSRAFKGEPREESRFRKAFNRGFDRFKNGWFRRTMHGVVRWRYTTLATAIGIMILTIGLMAGGRVGFVFFQGPESDRLMVNLIMAPGTSREATGRALDEVERAMLVAERELGHEPGEIVVMSVGRIGENIVRSGDQGRVAGDYVGGLDVELVLSDYRPVRTAAFIDAWRERVPPITGMESLTITERQGGPPGREVDIRMEGGADITDLKAAAQAVRAQLARLEGVSEIDDDLTWGKEEALIELTPRGRALGFSTEEVGRQLRDAFQGAVAKRFARGDEEVEVIVRLAEADRRSVDLASFNLVTREGLDVPLSEVATIRDDRGFAQIKREDGAREVAVTAELDEAVIRLEQVKEALGPEIAALAATKGLDWRFAGRSEEQADTLGDLRLGTMAALALIYIILAWVFGSFTRPIAVMAVIPFGIIGAVLGHMLLGYDLTILSLIALLGLSGILVNDSIVLVDRVRELQASGMDAVEAAIEGSVSRLRAVILTSATTVGGLSTLLFETSYQAQFLIPMAITLVFGLAINTFLVLCLLPSLVAIQGDFARRQVPAQTGAVARLDAA